MFESYKTYPPHSVIFKEGDEARHLILIKSGQVLCLKTSKDRLVPVFQAENKDIIGESGMFKDAPYTYSAITLTQVEVVLVDQEHFTKVFNDAPNWLYDLSLTMISRFQATSDLLAQNRIIHQSIVSEEQFSPTREVEFKKLLSQ
jgi:CRP-like cAMP-binding protein